MSLSEWHLPQIEGGSRNEYIYSGIGASKCGRAFYNEPLSKHTTWKIGGPADLLILPKGKEELITIVKLLHKHGLGWTNLGRGSNMLVSDKGVRGVVIKPANGFDYLRFEGTTAIAGASYSFIKLSVLTGKQGLSGLEFAGNSGDSWRSRLYERWSAWIGCVTCF